MIEVLTADNVKYISIAIAAILATSIANPTATVQALTRFTISEVKIGLKHLHLFTTKV